MQGGPSCAEPAASPVAPGRVLADVLARDRAATRTQRLAARWDTRGHASAILA